MPAGGAAPAHHPPNMLQPMEDMVLPPKRQAVVDRLRRRIETYRRRQTECVPRFDQSFTGACEQQNLETTQLQKRFLEGKAKRQVKKTDRKPDLPAISGNLHSSVHVQQKFGCGEYEPPASLQCGVGAGAGEALTKFSVEIVQQLEFTTSAADSQPQQISTNVTVKALANAVKTSGSPPPASPLDCERVCKAECKSEVADDEYVGLEECAAALERDAASAFPGLADLIGEDERDDAFEELMTDISEYAEFDFDLDGGKSLGDLVGGRQFGSELAPAAQTLRNMAEQHQAAAADWRYRPYARRQPDLALSQHQQLQLSQPHLQVSAAQHMQVSGGGGGHVSVAAQQGMYASFHSQVPSPQHHQGGNCESYSVSQSQSINLGQGGMRPRPAPAQPPPSPQQPLGVAAAGMSREHQAKMLQQQQQQMLRAQQQQMRPPPPEYKARFANVNPNLVNPSGMPGAGGIAPGMVGAPGMARRPPARQFAPHARQYAPEWRHVMMQQQNRQQFTHHHQGFGIGSMTMTQQQQQQMQLQRMQQQQLMQQQQQQRTTSQQNPMSHLIMQQNQMMNVQGQMQNIQMTQSQSMSMHQGGMGGMGGHQGSPMQNGPMQGQNGPMQGQNGPMQGQNGPMQGQNGPMHAQNSPMHAQNSPMQNSMMSNGMQSQSASSQSFLHSASSFPGQTADFNLDFLDNMPSTDASNLTAQELLNSLDNSFLNDIL